MPLDPARSHDRNEVSLRLLVPTSVLLGSLMAGLSAVSNGGASTGPLPRTRKRAGVIGNGPTYLARDIGIPYCRNEGVASPVIYVATGMLIHGLAISTVLYQRFGVGVAVRVWTRSDRLGAGGL